MHTTSVTRGYLKRYQYQVHLNTVGVNHVELTWCQENCVDEYGWFFDESHEGLTVMSFKDPVDAFMYKIARVR